jgi:AcrR family transcriptional regulator
MGSRLRRGRDLRRELIDEAVRLISENGLDNLSLRELARKTAVTHQAPYRHFPTRADLLVAIALEGYEMLRQQQIAALAEPFEADTDQEAAVPKRLLLCYARFALAHTSHYRVMWSADVGERKDRSPMVEAVRDTFEPMVEAIGAIRRKHGQTPPPSDYDVALSCWMLAHGTTLLYLDRHLQEQRSQMSLEALIIHLVRALKVGLPIDLSARG